MKKLNLFLSIVALSLATTNLRAVPTGALPGVFTVNADCGMVYFSKGNSTQASMTSFVSRQWEYGGYFELSQLNAFSNTTWHIVTRTELSYIVNSRPNANKLRALAKITSNTATQISGLILLPDNWVAPSNAISDKWDLCALNDGAMDYNKATFTYSEWTQMENLGAVFLPAAGYGNGNDVGTKGCYGDPQSSYNSRYYVFCILVWTATNFASGNPTTTIGSSVRLVQYVPDSEKPKATVTSAPTAVSDLTYTATSQSLVNEGIAQNGTLTYRYKNDDGGSWSSWTTTVPSATNAGNYTVRYYAAGSGCFQNSATKTVNVTIAKGNLDLSGLTVAGDELTFTGTAQELLTVTGSVPNATIHYSTDGIDFSSPDIPKASTAGEHHVWYQVIPNDAANYNTPDPVEVVATISYPTVSEDANPASVLSALYNDNNPIETSLLVNRYIWADGEYNTICLPFSLDETALAASPLAGKERLKAFKGATVTGAGQDLYIDIFVEDVTAIEAGVPYLITFPAESGDLTSLLFNGIQVTTTSPGAVSANGVTFQGIFGPTHITTYEENTAESRNEDYLFVGSGSQLFWPNDDGSSMPGFRAYFIVDRAAGSPISLAPKGTRARILDAPKTTTDIDELNTSICTKLIENGQLYIIKNGVKYNAQGIIVK